MNAKFIWFMIGAMQLTTAAYSSNSKLLDNYAESIKNRIWSGTSLRTDEIKAKLGFVYTPEKADEKYKQEATFNALTNTIDDKKFQQFAQNCRTIYAEKNTKTQVAIHMLLEKTAEKYAQELKRFRNLEALKREEEKEGPSENLEQKVQYFLNADKTNKQNGVAT